MAGFWTWWDRLGRALTLPTVLAILFPTGVLVSLALWLAYVTTFVRIFAPLSYLLVAVVALILGLISTGAALSVAKHLGWSPKRRKLKLPARNASLAQVLQYVARQSAYGIDNVTGETKLASIAHELMDRVVENGLTVWGRVGNFPVSQIEPHALESSVFDLSAGVVKRVTEWATVDYRDVQFNWRQVRRTWPRPPIWRRIIARLTKPQPLASDNVPGA